MEYNSIILTKEELGWKVIGKVLHRGEANA